MSDAEPIPTGEPWQWPEPVWRRIVGRARAGRSLKPTSWPGGARCAVALSFDADHDTIPLRDGDQSPMRISQGQYGSRRGVPRIRAVLDREGVPASFFYPAVSALLYPDEVRGVAADGHEIGIHSWIHERNTSLPYEAERELSFRAADVLAEGGEVPLFENGQPSAFTQQAIQFCTDFETERRRTEQFVQTLRSLDLLESKQTTFTPRAPDGTAGEPIQLADYFAVSEEKLAALPAAKIAELNASGALRQIYAHLTSMLNWDRLVTKTAIRSPVANA